VPRNKMTCREFVGLIPAYRDGELSSADRQSFSEHTCKCGRCSHYLKGYELTVSTTKRIAEDSRDPGETMMPKSLVSRILSHKLKRPGAS
jgi:anti-sigma factor RsiW